MAALLTDIWIIDIKHMDTCNISTSTDYCLSRWTNYIILNLQQYFYVNSGIKLTCFLRNCSRRFFVLFVCLFLFILFMLFLFFLCFVFVCFLFCFVLFYYFFFFLSLGQLLWLCCKMAMNDLNFYSFYSCLISGLFRGNNHVCMYVCMYVYEALHDQYRSKCSLGIASQLPDCDQRHWLDDFTMELKKCFLRIVMVSWNKG